MSDNRTSIRIRLTDEQMVQLEVVRQWLGLRSVSATAARLVTWNCASLASALGVPGVAPSPRMRGQNANSAGASIPGLLGQDVADFAADVWHDWDRGRPVP